MSQCAKVLEIKTPVLISIQICAVKKIIILLQLSDIFKALNFHLHLVLWCFRIVLS